MKLRIIAGQLKRRTIVLPKSASRFRPTKDIVREAVASMLGRSVQGAVVADMCAGSGAFGFEMISRGAQTVHFVEINRERCRGIASHAHRFDVESRCTISAVDIRSYLKACSLLFDIIYYDPPYDSEELVALIPDILPLLAKKGMMIFEYGEVNRYGDMLADDEIPDYSRDIRKFGKTALCCFTRH